MELGTPADPPLSGGVLPSGVMDDIVPPENPFARVRLRGVWAWVLGSGVVLAPLVWLGIWLGWLVPRRDLFLVLGVWLYAAPLAWLLDTARCHGIHLRRWFARPASGTGWLEALAIVPPQLLFSATSFLLVITLLALVFPEAAQRFMSRPEMSEIAPPGAPRPLVAVMLVLIAPVAEELLFRGLLLHTLASRWGFRRAAFFTAGFFALLHANLLGIFVFGLVLTVLYMKTRSLLAPMLCHAFNNLFPLLMSLRMPGAARRPAPETVAELRSHAAFVAVAAGVSGVFMLTYLKHRWPAAGATLPYDDARESEGTAPPSAPLAPLTGWPSESDAGAAPETVSAPGATDDDESTSSRDRSPSPPPA